MINKALIIDEPWISKILKGDKVWEMRSTKASHRGHFGLIRKGSGQVVGVANLTNVSGPYENSQLSEAYGSHCVEADIYERPEYKWRYAWHLSDVRRLSAPVSYIHKSGAVTWVNLNPDAITAIANSNGAELAEGSFLERVMSTGELTISIGGTDSTLPFTLEMEKIVKEDDRSAVSERNTPLSKKVSRSSELVPISRDGSYFSLEVCSKQGIYTVGNKGEEKKFSNYTEALSYLEGMDTARWRRPNANGNWGIVSAIDWVVPK